MIRELLLLLLLRELGVPLKILDCWWALFGNRAAEINNEGDSVY